MPTLYFYKNLNTFLKRFLSIILAKSVSQNLKLKLWHTIIKTPIFAPISISLRMYWWANYMITKCSQIKYFVTQFTASKPRQNVDYEINRLTSSSWTCSRQFRTQVTPFTPTAKSCNTEAIIKTKQSELLLVCPLHISSRWGNKLWSMKIVI